MFVVGFRRAAGVALKPCYYRPFSTVHYFKSHEWVKVDGKKAVLGITHHAQEQLGEIVYVDLPGEGDKLDAKSTIITLESVKAVGEVYAPADMTVTKINDKLEDEPTLVNKKAESDGWLIELQLDGDIKDALNKEQYDKWCEEEAH